MNNSLLKAFSQSRIISDQFDLNARERVCMVVCVHGGVKGRLHEADQKSVFGNLMWEEEEGRKEGGAVKRLGLCAGCWSASKHSLNAVGCCTAVVLSSVVTSNPWRRSLHKLYSAISGYCLWPQARPALCHLSLTWRNRWLFQSYLCFVVSCVMVIAALSDVSERDGESC